MIGVLCGGITLVLWINLQLMKKLSRRMERINTFIQIQATSLAVMAVALMLVESLMINFIHGNSSQVILESIPWQYHKWY